jgi:hypothetical protein
MREQTEARYNRAFRIIKGETEGSCHCGRVLDSRCNTSSSSRGNSTSRDAASSEGKSSGSSGSASIGLTDDEIGRIQHCPKGRGALIISTRRA